MTGDDEMLTNWPTAVPTKLSTSSTTDSVNTDQVVSMIDTEHLEPGPGRIVSGGG